MAFLLYLRVWLSIFSLQYPVMKTEEANSPNYLPLILLLSFGCAVTVTFGFIVNRIIPTSEERGQFGDAFGALKVHLTPFSPPLLLRV